MKSRYFYLSLLIHSSIFLLPILIVMPNEQALDQNVIQSFVLDMDEDLLFKREDLAKRERGFLQPLISPIIKNSNLSLLKKPGHEKLNQSAQPLDPHVLQKAHAVPHLQSGNDKVNREILKLLHNQIALKQKYPDSALLLNQSGTVTIRFMLYPNGDMNDIRLSKSSGFDILDTAALAAVNAIAPFHDAHLYLQKAELFSVNVTFAS